MAVGALVTCDDRVCEDKIGAGGRTPTRWRGYGSADSCGGGAGRRVGCVVDAGGGDGGGDRVGAAAGCGRRGGRGGRADQDPESGVWRGFVAGRGGGGATGRGGLLGRAGPAAG